MKLYYPIWFKIFLIIMLVLYTITIIPFVVSIKSIEYYYGISALPLTICYLLIIISIILMLIYNKKGYYIFIFVQLAIPIIYFMFKIDFSIENVILRPVVFGIMVYLGMNIKKQD